MKFQARLELEGLNAEVAVDHLETTGALIELFTEMAREWKGWKGSKRWSSNEGSLVLECSHDGLGHISARVSLRHHLNPDWSADGELVLEAGTLDQLAREVTQYFQSPR